VQVAVERFLHGHHILNIRNGLDTDLFALFYLRLGDLHRRHFDAFSIQSSAICEEDRYACVLRIVIFSMECTMRPRVILSEGFWKTSLGRCRWPAAGVL